MEDGPEPPTTAFDPILRGSVDDLLITPRFAGRFDPTVNFRPDAIVFVSSLDRTEKRVTFQQMQTFIFREYIEKENRKLTKLIFNFIIFVRGKGKAI